MSELLGNLLGEYAFYFIIGAQDVILSNIYIFLLNWKKKKRKLFVLKLFISLIVQFAFCLFVSFMRTNWQNIFVTVIFNGVFMLALPFVTLLLCYDQKTNEVFLAYASLIAVKNVASSSFTLLLNLCGIDDQKSISFFNDTNEFRDWLIYYMLQFFITFIICFFIRRGEKKHGQPLETKQAIILATFAFFISGLVSPTIRCYQSESFHLAVCIRVLFLIIYILIIVVRAGILSQNKVKADLKLTESLLERERKHYVEIKDNMEIINMKCHDIKNQLGNLQGKLTSNEIETLKKAIEIYDGNIKTGNEIVDTVLYQKKMFCDSNQIKLTYVIDGKSLSFMDPTELYSLLSNALENAIEAVMKLEPSKRIISLVVNKKECSSEIVIELTNYFDASENVSLDTSKNDKIHHGFGIKSMKYVVERYKGNISFEKERDIFYLTINLPCL